MLHGDRATPLSLTFDDTRGMMTRPRAREGALPDWITPSGVDPGRLPVEPLLHQALTQHKEQFRSACNLLAAMVSHGRQDAGVVLLGLLSYYRDDFERLAEVVRALRAFQSRESVEALINELRRVMSSNTTRRYLDAVLTALSSLPGELVYDRLLELSRDRSFSVKWRRKFEDAARRLEGP
jgi:hypothetical protein